MPWISLGAAPRPGDFAPWASRPVRSKSLPFLLWLSSSLSSRRRLTCHPFRLPECHRRPSLESPLHDSSGGSVLSPRAGSPRRRTSSWACPGLVSLHGGPQPVRQSPLGRAPRQALRRLRAFPWPRFPVVLAGISCGANRRCGGSAPPILRFFLRKSRLFQVLASSYPCQRQPHRRWRPGGAPNRCSRWGPRPYPTCIAEGPSERFP